MAWIKEGQTPFKTNPAAITLKLKNHAAMDELVKGKGTRDHCDMMIAALNITEAFSMMGIGDEYQEEIKAGQDAMLTMCQRGLSKDKFIFTGPELTAINLVMEIHDAQLDHCTLAELEQAIKVVSKVIKEKKAKLIEGKP
mgnify:CR=1 FL=1